MKPSSFQTTIENQFDYICKRAMEDERKNYMLYLSRIAKREVSFSDVGDYLVSQFATTDNYSTDFQIFTLNGLSVGVENDLLSEALREFAFTGSLVAMITNNFTYGVIAAIVNMIIVFVIGDLTAPKVEETLGLPGVSIPHGFSAAFVPIAWVVNKIIDLIPGVRDIDISTEKLQKKFGVFGEPILVGTVLGLVIGALAGYDFKTVCTTGITLGATLVLIPKMAALLMEGLMPISEAAQEFISKKFQNRGRIYIGLDSAVAVGHPICLTISLILVPLAIFLAVILPGNTVLPMTDLSVFVYMFVLIVPMVGGNGFRTLITGIVSLILGLYISTNMASATTSVAASVGFEIPDGATTISSICDGANPLSWILVKAHELGIIGVAVAVVIALALAVWNRKRILKQAAEMHAGA